MSDDVLRWPTVGETYLEVLHCLGAVLVDLLGGIMDLSTADAFEILLEAGSVLVLVNLNGVGGEGTLTGPIDSNRFLPVMSRFWMGFTAFETFRHMLDFRSIVSLFGLEQKTCGWAICITTFAANFASWSAANMNVSVFGCGRVFWLTTDSYVFLLIDHLLPECLLFVFWTPSVR